MAAMIAGLRRALYDRLRIIDESGEGYLYIRRLFESIAVPKRVEAALIAGS